MTINLVALFWTCCSFLILLAFEACSGTAGYIREGLIKARYRCLFLLIERFWNLLSFISFLLQAALVLVVCEAYVLRLKVSPRHLA